MIHRDARGNDQERKDHGGEAFRQHMRQMPQRQWPAIGERAFVEVRLERGIGGERDAARYQDQAELQIEEG